MAGKPVLAVDWEITSVLIYMDLPMGLLGFPVLMAAGFQEGGGGPQQFF